MNVLEINSVPYGSTAKISLGIANLVDQPEDSIVMAYGYSYHPLQELKGKHIQIGTAMEKMLHIVGSKFLGQHGILSRFATYRFLKKVKKINPDIIHLHNLHGYYIHLPLLFKYIKQNRIKVVWTLHDCWAFTGHCPHFDMIGCEKWKTGCFSCPQYRDYPQTYIDRSKTMYEKKKKWFLGVEDLTIVTPSNWLAKLVSQSFLKDYAVKVINNGIDLSVFKPTESDFKKKYNCENKKIVLGVAFGWGKRKGLDVFVELSKRLPENYQIVLVGTDDSIDKELPKNIISIHRTQDQKELAELYTTADLFVNPTREENFPTVNIEALACGTPVLTFKTGGSPEIIDESCGSVVEKNDIDSLYNEIIRIIENKAYSKKACLIRASGFEKTKKFSEYMELYKASV